ncbi:MAG: DUF2520 domain-containing protein [Bdellovibrionota bacterium]
MNNKLLYGLVGDGKAATHISYYFDLLGISYVQWSRKKANTDPEATAPRVLAPADTIIVLISDSAIPTWIESQPTLSGKTFVHMSGSLTTSAAMSVHPLMMLGEDLYDLSTYATIPFVVEKNSISFADLFPDLPNPHYTIEPQHKALYHALCVISGNFTTMLWKQAFEKMQSECKLPETILLPYMKSVFHNLEKGQQHTKATGPISRKDKQTIEKNLEALEKLPDLQKIYKSFLTQ